MAVSRDSDLSTTTLTIATLSLGSLEHHPLKLDQEKAIKIFGTRLVAVSGKINRAVYIHQYIYRHPTAKQCRIAGCYVSGGHTSA